MNKANILLMILLLATLAGSLAAQMPLSTLIGSGTYAGGSLDVITPSDRAETLIFSNGGTLGTIPTQEWTSLPGWRVATLNVPDYPYIGFRGLDSNERVNPVFWNQTTTPPANIYTPLETDAAGDHLFTSAWLDIRATEMTFSNERLFFGIKNTSNTFPTSSGITYFSYMIVLVDPDADPASNPTVYGLMYTVNIPGVIGPGLYKITGTGFSDLTRIGDITASIDASTSTLRLSCALADLTADADFSSWYDPQYPRVITTALTSRISLVSGTQQSDITEGVELLLLPQALPLQNMHAPVLCDANVMIVNEGTDVLVAQVSYSDADPNFPRIASVSVDGSPSIPMTLVNNPVLDFPAGMRYEAVINPAPENWGEAVFTFSHGDATVHTSVTYIVSNHDPYIPQAGFALHLWPNPAKNLVNLQVKGADLGLRKVELFNIKGQKVLQTAMSDMQLEINTASLPSGLYLARVSDQSGGKAQKRFIKIP